MKTFIHGNDQGSAVLMALVLIMVLSTLFISFVPRVTAQKSFARDYKERVIHKIEEENMEILKRYELY